MTAQSPDRLHWNDADYPLLGTPPLGPYLSLSAPRPPSSGNWRGYVASWSIDEQNQLFLVEVEALSASVSVDTPGAVMPIAARWVNGDFRVGIGSVLRYHHSGFDSIYEREATLTIRSGEVIGVRYQDGREAARDDRRLDALIATGCFLLFLLILVGPGIVVYLFSR